MTEYQIQPNTRRCAVSGRELKPGERYFSVLHDEAGKFVRKDYGAEAWQGPPADAFSFWAGRVQAAGARTPPPIDDDMLLECFQRLEGRTEPAGENFRFVLALLLMRRKQLQVRGGAERGRPRSALSAMRPHRRAARGRQPPPNRRGNGGRSGRRVPGPRLGIKPRRVNQDIELFLEGGPMRRLTIFAGLIVAVVAFGCLPGCRRELVPDAPSPAVTAQKPSPAQLVAYMNDNAHLVQSIKSTNLEIQAKQAASPSAWPARCSARSRATSGCGRCSPVKPAVDIGSNSDEFWFWISQAKDEDGVARVHYCSYTDMAAGKARMPFPFQPDMIVAALGMGEYDPSKEYSLKEDARTVSLVEKTVSAQGQPVQRVTVFNRTQAAPGMPQVLAHLLLDDKGNEICRASILDVRTVQIGQDRAVVPQRVKLVWRPQQIELEMWLKDTSGERHRRAARRQAVQPGRPGEHPVVQPRPGGAGCAERVFADVDPADGAERAGGEVRAAALLRRLARQVAAVNGRRRRLDAFTELFPRS